MTNDGATLIGTKQYNDRKNILEEIREFIKDTYPKPNYFTRKKLRNEYNDDLIKQNKTDDVLTDKNVRTITSNLEAEGFLKIDNGKGITLV
jgi:hypothetical protein